MPFKLKSSAFANDDLIPSEFTADGKDISPPLAWSGAPVGTASFALVMKDRDAKEKGVHWVIWNLPATTHSLSKGINPLPNGALQGRNDFHRVGYSGPRPTQVTEHSYEFTLYALNSKLGLGAGSTEKELLARMGGPAGNVLAETQLVGRFKPEKDAARHRALENDREFVGLRDQITRDLEDAYKARPEKVSEFFKRYSLPSLFAAGKIDQFLAAIRDNTVRRSLEDYVRFANRFQVQFRLRRNPLKFKLLPQPSYGAKFHVNIVGDHLEPGEPVVVSEGEAFRDLFAANDLKISDEAQKLIDEGKATFTQIADGGGYSILSDFETFAYKDDGVAIFVHNAGQQPYIGCIFGEKMTKQLLHDLGTTITEFQKKHFSRTSGGRPPDMDRRKKMLEVDRQPISNKAKAIELAEGGDEKKVKTQEVKLSKLRTKRRKGKR